MFHLAEKCAYNRFFKSYSDTFVRPMYAGNVLAKVAIKDPTKRKVLSVRPTSFEKAALEDIGNVETIDSVVPFDKAEWVGESVSKSDRPDLQSAGTVVSGGRGIKVRSASCCSAIIVLRILISHSCASFTFCQSGENFVILEALADKLNAAVGASRAAVDAGFCPNDWCVCRRIENDTMQIQIFSNAYCTLCILLIQASGPDWQGSGSRSLHCCWYFGSYSAFEWDEGFQMHCCH